jgi:hypothetical protein
LPECAGCYSLRHSSSSEEAAVVPNPHPRFTHTVQARRMEWERDYMHTLVKALDVIPDVSRVLEIGWGCGYSAAAIQAQRPQLHVVIECSDLVVARAEPWAARHTGARIAKGYWQQVMTSGELAGLEFDRVFFDDFPLPLDGSAGGENTGKAGSTGARTAQEVVSSSPDRHSMPHVNAAMPSPHICALSGGGGEEEAEAHAAVMAPQPGRSRWCEFVQTCLPLMSERGGVITGYMARAVEVDVEGVDVATHTCSVQVPPNCPYFPYDTACVPVLTVRGRAERRKRRLRAMVAQSLGLQDA